MMPHMPAEPPSVDRLLDLSGRVAVVTGATGTIGGGIARRLHEAGASVVVHTHARPEAAEALVTRLGERAAAVTGDVERDAAAICRCAVDTFGALHVVVNNAGVQPVVAFDEIDAAAAADVLRVNVSGVIAMTHEAAALMRDGGAIVHVGSIEGLQPAFDHSHYAASKAAVIMHARAAALELGPRGIRVNCVSPGLIDTEGGLENAWPSGVERWHAAAPLHRLGQPADVADAVLFLASDAARWITGANLVVDGGVLSRNTW